MQLRQGEDFCSESSEQGFNCRICLLQRPQPASQQTVPDSPKTPPRPPILSPIIIPKNALGKRLKILHPVSPSASEVVTDYNKPFLDNDKENVNEKMDLLNDEAQWEDVLFYDNDVNELETFRQSIGKPGDAIDEGTANLSFIQKCKFLQIQLLHSQKRLRCWSPSLTPRSLQKTGTSSSTRSLPVLKTLLSARFQN